MNTLIKFFILNFFILYTLLNCSFTTKAVEHICTEDTIKNDFQHAFSDYRLSPYTGYTREHWLEITEKIISGVLPYFNLETGMPDLAKTTGDSAFEYVRRKNPKEEKKRALERIMMAVIVYVKATGEEQVPDYKGSITAPFIKAIIKGTDPDDPLYWGDPEPNDQVGSIFSLGVYLNPEIFWDPLTNKQKQNILKYLQKQTFNKTYDNNHYYFHMVSVALLEKNGLEANRDHLTHMYGRLMGWYRGNGWFIDGSNQGFDYYNFWGFQLFNQILYRFDPKWHDLFGKKIIKTTALFFETSPFLFGRDGGSIPWGRSLSYRFANISFIGWSVLNGTCNLPLGQIRRIASGSLKYFWEHGCLGENNLLNIGYWRANSSMAEDYLAPGDAYWATQGLSCLLIPKDHPFWTTVEEPIPADRTGGKIAVSGAQFTIRVSPLDGEARLFPVGQPWAQDRKKWQTGSKYDQHAYSSFLGFCTVGENGDDLGAGRSGYSYDGTNWFYRERANPIQVDPYHLISSYKLKPKRETDLKNKVDQGEIITHTLVGDDGEVHIFWHNCPEPLYMFLGSYGLSVRHDGALSEQEIKNGMQINSEDYYSVIQAIEAPKGVCESRLLIPRKGWSDTHLFGGKGAFPFWHSTNPVPPNLPLIFFTNGTRARKPVIGSVYVIQKDGGLRIRFDGKWYTIHVPFNKHIINKN